MDFTSTLGECDQRSVRYTTLLYGYGYGMVDPCDFICHVHESRAMATTENAVRTKSLISLLEFCVNVQCTYRYRCCVNNYRISFGTFRVVNTHWYFFGLIISGHSTFNLGQRWPKSHLAKIHATFSSNAPAKHTLITINLLVWNANRSGQVIVWRFWYHELRRNIQHLFFFLHWTHWMCIACETPFAVGLLKPFVTAANGTRRLI